ncbi:MAG: class I SAM-dependent methyltransferase [Firmicutes bacterium]|nr:class I SAM-dependent methyltransferase [Bacillota bacterium]
MSHNEWQEFFDNHAPDYMNNIFTKNTDEEAAFIRSLLQPEPGAAILDVGCGTGRHSVALAKMGYKMTGLDISEGMLKEAERAAEAEGVEVEFIQANARDFKFDRKWDAALCLCEGAFGLLSSEDDPVMQPVSILKNINEALKPGGRLILTCLNGMKKIRNFSKEGIDNGLFDPVNITEKFMMEFDTPEGKKQFRGVEKGFVPSELAIMLKMSGFETEHIWGGTAGNWGRRGIDPDEYEIMVIACKIT